MLLFKKNINWKNIYHSIMMKDRKSQDKKKITDKKSQDKKSQFSFEIIFFEQENTNFKNIFFVFFFLQLLLMK